MNNDLPCIRSCRIPKHHIILPRYCHVHHEYSFTVGLHKNHNGGFQSTARDSPGEIRWLFLSCSPRRCGRSTADTTWTRHVFQVASSWILARINEYNVQQTTRGFCILGISCWLERRHEDVALNLSCRLVRPRREA
jgi:hypothetical protein